jgi:hypothetical protein
MLTFCTVPFILHKKYEVFLYDLPGILYSFSTRRNRGALFIYLQSNDTE